MLIAVYKKFPARMRPEGSLPGPEIATIESPVSSL
jgi:hypothetical protein